MGAVQQNTRILCSLLTLSLSCFTPYIADIAPVPKSVSKKKSAQPSLPLATRDDPDVPSDSTASEDEDDLPDTDDETFEGETSSSKRNTKKSGGVKRKVAALVEEDEEYVGDEDRDANRSKKIPSKVCFVALPYESG